MARLTLPVHLRWGDLDAYGHVNNAAMLTLLEEVRIEAFWRHPDADAPQHPTAVLDAGPGADLATLVARQEVEYLAPLGYSRSGVTVEMWIGRLGGASIDVCYEVRNGSTVCARAATTVVLVDAATGQPTRLGEAERAAWEPYVEAPITFRHR